MEAGSGQNSARGKRQGQERASDHLVLKAVRERAMMPGPGSEPHWAVHWRGEPAPLMPVQWSCSPGAGKRHCSSRGQPSGSQVRAGGVDHAWRGCCSHQDAECISPPLTGNSFPRSVSSPGLALGQLCFPHSLGGYEDKVTVA